MIFLFDLFRINVDTNIVLIILSKKYIFAKFIYRLLIKADEKISYKSNDKLKNNSLAPIEESSLPPNNFIIESSMKKFRP